MSEKKPLEKLYNGYISPRASQHINLGADETRGYVPPSAANIVAPVSPATPSSAHPSTASTPAAPDASAPTEWVFGYQAPGTRGPR